MTIYQSLVATVRGLQALPALLKELENIRTLIEAYVAKFEDARAKLEDARTKLEATRAQIEGIVARLPFR